MKCSCAVITRVSHHYDLPETLFHKYHAQLLQSKSARTLDAGTKRTVLRALLVVGLLCRYYPLAEKKGSL